MAAVSEKFVLNSPVDGLKLHGVDMHPAEMGVRGVVVLVHGMCEHKERYFPFMEYLCSIGYACLIYDQRGHGESVNNEEDLGFLYGHGERSLIEDVEAVVKEAKDRYPGENVHLFGHSMGSLVVRNYLAKYDDEITSLTVSGCVANNPAAGAGKFMASLVGLICGKHYRSKLITTMAFGSYNKKFDHPASPNAWLNSDEEAVKVYDDDPLCGFTFTTDGYKALMQMIKDCYDASKYQKKNTSLPILFLSGTDDPCCSGKKGFDEAVAFLKDMGYENCSGVMMRGMRHEILNEPEHEKVYELIAANIGR